MNTNKTYTIITIDDHPFLREGVTNFLKRNADFDLLGDFEDIRTVLNTSFPTEPDVVILDLNLKGIDGEAGCPQLKQKFPRCKIIAFTQYEGKAKKLEQIGFDGYVLKSDRDDVLTVAIMDVLSGKKYFSNEKKGNSQNAAKFYEEDDFLKFKKLTGREIEIARYILQNYTNKEIGEKIHIEQSTVETHRKHIKEKIGAKTKRDFYTMLESYLQSG